MDQPIRTSGRRYFSIKEVAEMYGVCERTVTTWIESGELPAISASQSSRSGKPRWRIAEKGLDQFDARRAKSPPAPKTKRRNTAKAGQVEEFL